MTFSIFFFSIIIFSYQYLPGTKVYLEPSQTTTMEPSRYFFSKIDKKTPGPQSLCPANSLKERTPTQVFSDEFYEILKTEYIQATASALRKNILSIK